VGIKERFNHWYTKPRKGTFWDMGRWMYEDKDAFKIVFIYGHIGAVLVFSFLVTIFIIYGFSPIIIIILSIMDAAAIYKAVKLYKSYKSGVFQQFIDEFSVKTFQGGNKNGIKTKVPGQECTTSSTNEQKLHGNSNNTERHNPEPKRVSKGISFSVLVAEETSREPEDRDTDTLDPDGC